MNATVIFFTIKFKFEILKQLQIGDWSDRSAGKGIGCSCREAGLGSQHHMAADNGF